MVESCMICLRESDHKLSWTLIKCQNLDSVGDKSFRGQHGDKLKEQVGLLLEQFWNSSSHSILKL